MSQRRKEGVFSFPYAFTEEGLLGHGMENDVGMILIPLKRSVISLQVVGKPLVPHFPGRAAERCWWSRGWGWGGQGLQASCPGPGLWLLTQGSLEGDYLLCTEPPPPECTRLQVMLQETSATCSQDSKQTKKACWASRTRASFLRGLTRTLSFSS